MDLAAHVLVPVAAENIAGKIEAAGLVRYEPRLDCLSRDYFHIDLEGRRIETHRHVLGAEFEHHRHAFLERDFRRRVLEFLRDNADDFLLRLGEGGGAEYG